MDLLMSRRLENSSTLSSSCVFQYSFETSYFARVREHVLNTPALLATICGFEAYREANILYSKTPPSQIFAYN